MKSKQKIYKLLDLAQYMGVEIEDVRAACKTYDISLGSDASLSHEQAQYLIKSLKANNAEWGEELHLETGMIGHHVDRGIMREGQGDEQEHGHTVHQRAQRLGVTEELMLAELASAGFKLESSSPLRQSVLAKIIDRLEIQHTWNEADEKYHEFDTTHSLDSENQHKKHATKESGSCSTGAMSCSSKHQTKKSSATCSKNTCTSSSAVKSSVSCSRSACAAKSDSQKTSSACGTKKCDSTHHSAKHSFTQKSLRSETFSEAGSCDSSSSSINEENSKEYRVVDLAKRFGIPAVALMTWLNQRGITDAKLTEAQATEITSMIEGRTMTWSSCELKSGVKVCDSKKKHEESEQISGIVATSDDVVDIDEAYTHYEKTGVGPVAWSRMNRLSAAAWMMLGLLAIPLVGLFLNRDSGAINQLASGTVETPVGVTEAVEHGVNDLFDKLEMKNSAPKAVKIEGPAKKVGSQAMIAPIAKKQVQQNTTKKTEAEIDKNVERLNGESINKVVPAQPVDNENDMNAMQKAITEDEKRNMIPADTKIHRVSELPATGASL